jgi:radical SAM protein with 4Fe4S-binding SPASM domain
MNPDLCAMIEYAKARGIRTIVSTNGHLLTDPALAERVVQSGLDTLIFAIDGISQETYERYRGRGRLADALAGLKTVVAARKKRGGKTPLINFRFIAMSHNEHEIPMLESFVRNTGADVLTIKTLNTCANDTYGERAGERQQREDAFLPEAQRYRRFVAGPELSSRVRRGTNACKNLWNSPTVHWDGTIAPCTYDYNERFILGGLQEQSVAKIWNGPAYREMRKHFIQQDVYFCRECSYAFVGGSCLGETVRDIQRLNPDVLPS